MKKILSLILVLVVSLSLLTACGSSSDESASIIIGVSSEPHATLVELIVDDLKEEGIDVEIIEFTDYVTPNTSLDDGDIDANFFQHKPYLEDFVENQGMKLVSLGGVHIEPMALYSSSINSIEDLQDGSEISIPNDNVNGGRALLLLEANGLIKLDKDSGVEVTEKDIIDNPKNLKINPLEAAFLPRTLDEVDAAVINGNYALEAGLNPVDDGLIIEDADSPYVNVVVVRDGEEKEEKFIKLLKALQSDKVKAYIEDNYNGGVVPAFN
ncbi:MAG TPA: MetQ/NlpA family ABC transporter substrate-binding protein [Clostridia bacterium]|nr:MetQ/NlpA family ABC transporter substrate-binding protein [Clostridia bacterium]